MTLQSLMKEGEFETICKEIYPPEIKLKKENIDYSEGSLLDLGIKINIQLYDKRDDFLFSIIMSHLTRALLGNFGKMTF